MSPLEVSASLGVSPRVPFFQVSGCKESGGGTCGESGFPNTVDQTETVSPWS